MIEPVDPASVVFDPAALLTALAAHGVEFVVIGGIAALLRGDDAATSDADIIVRPTALAALLAALEDLGARLLVQLDQRNEATVDLPLSLETFRPLSSARFLTRYGVLDVVLRPDGVPDYETWAAGATPADVGGGAIVQVASLDDVIASKAAASRPKDRLALPRLVALRDLIRERGRQPH